MVKSYRVAGHSFNIEANCDLSFWNRIEENYGPFETKEGERPLFSLSVCDNFDILDKKIVFSNRDSVEEGFITIDIYQSGNGHYFEFTQPHSPQTNGKLLINGSQSEAKLSLHGNMLEQFNTLNTAANFCFMAATASLNTIMVHSSTIIYKGKAYMFLGKSGTGKSTHSRMWLNSIMGTELLNFYRDRIKKSPTALSGFFCCCISIFFSSVCNFSIFRIIFFCLVVFIVCIKGTPLKIGFLSRPISTPLLYAFTIKFSTFLR